MGLCGDICHHACAEKTENLQVNQPVPVAASVSQEIAAQLNQAKVEEEREDYQSEKEVESDGVSLDQDSNQSVHLSGENIALDDDCDEEVDELEADEEEKEEGDVVVKHDAVVGVKREMDTAAKITSLLSELTSESESREVIQSRWFVRNTPQKWTEITATSPKFQ